MQKTRLLTAGLMMAGFGAMNAGNAETLQDALIAAYTGNPTLEAQRAYLRSRDELVPQALSNWRPTIQLSGDVARTNTSTKYETLTLAGTQAVSQTVTASPNVLELQVSQPLYRGGRTVAQTEQAEAQVRAARAQLAVTEQTVLLNAATAYMDVVEYQAVLELSINDEQVLQRQLEATDDRFRVGEVTRTDVSQAQSRLSAAHADRTQAAGNLRAAAAIYVNVVGHPPENLVAPNQFGEIPGSIDVARDQALVQNPNIINAQHNYEAEDHGIDVVAGELLPTVTLNGQVQRNYDYDGPRSFERIYQAAINLTVPLYQQGQEYSRLRQQKHVAGQARIDVDVSRRDVVESVTKAWEALETARARIVSYTDQITAAQVALDGVQRESQVGSRTVLDVLNAEQELLNAKVNLVQAKHDEAVAAFQVKGTVGQMTAEALGLPVAVYDATQHYDDVRDQWVGTGVEPNYGGK